MGVYGLQWINSEPVLGLLFQVGVSPTFGIGPKSNLKKPSENRSSSSIRDWWDGALA